MTTSDAGSTDAVAVPEPESAELIEDVLIDDELIIEEISIDGMCGVY
jgi:mycofactocin precursor